MSTPQQRVREVLGEEFEVQSVYEAGRGGHSYMVVTPSRYDLDIVKHLSAGFETWKLVREIDGVTHVTHLFLVRSKKGILRGAVAYNGTDNTSRILDVDNWRVLRDLEGFHQSNRNMKGTVSYEKL